MRVETPQILWHSEEDKGINAALMGVSLIKSGIDIDNKEYGHVLATAGNSNLVHLWKVTFGESSNATTSNCADNFESPPKMFLKAKGSNCNSQFDYLFSLTRHEGPVNVVAFSPDGLHLATASETGAVLVYSVPQNKQGNGNGRHFWSIAQEKDLHVRRVMRNGDGGVTDLSWSSDSQRFFFGSLDHSVAIVELAANKEDWKVVYHNGMDHTHYVQGVTYDPLGVYLASMSSDRTVRVFPRKNTKAMKKIHPPRRVTPNIVQRQPSPQEQRVEQQVLQQAKLELSRSKEIRKSKRITTTDEEGGSGSNNENTQWSFADESTLGSFVRRLAWTRDGAFLIVPAALWPATQSYATLLFARHQYDEPYRVLQGLDKPSVAVRPNPVRFALPTDAKENQSPHLAYRSVFCVLTWDSVLIYDTYHTKPLAIIKGLHYANLVDATWSDDGHELIVCSTDGYLSLVQFRRGELGEVYLDEQEMTSEEAVELTAVTQPNKVLPTVTNTTQLPPCDPGPVAVEAPPAKKLKRIAPVPVVTTEENESKRLPEEEAMDRLSITPPLQPTKKKKRVQPTLLSSVES